LGRRYLLFNSELNKTVYDRAFFRVQVGSFFDTGAVSDPSGLFASGKWLFGRPVGSEARNSVRRGPGPFLRA
jgi:hypothetical protein